MTRRMDDSRGKKNVSTLWLALLVGAAAILYGVLMPHYEVGASNDDALYILGAQSLLTGHYGSLQYPRHPPLTDPLPGYSLFLSPFVGLVQPHWAFLKVTTLLLTAGSGLLFWFLLEPWFDPKFRVLAVALYLLNPVTALFSVQLFSEPCFLFVVLLLFIGFLYREKREKTSMGLVWGVLLGWAMMIRPQGTLVALALAFTMMAIPRWRSLWPAFLLAVAIAGSVLARNMVLTGSPTHYLTHWMQSRATTAPRAHAVQSWLAVMHGLFFESLIGISENVGTAPWILIPSVLVLIGVMGRGIAVLVRKTPRSEGVVFMMSMFCLFYVLLQMLWVSANVRYFLPLIPFFILFLIAGLETLFRGRGARLLLPLFGLALLAFYVVRDAQLVQADASSAAVQLPRKTYQWIHQSLPSNAFVLSSKPSTLHLYAGCYSSFTRPAASDEEFRYTLLKGGVTHILFQHAVISSPLYASLWRKTEEWVFQRPADFSPIYSNPEEQTLLYRVNSEPGFVERFERTNEAVDR
jgi:hypothetical protein